jgi:hypothetical protein
MGAPWFVGAPLERAPEAPFFRAAAALLFLGKPKLTFFSLSYSLNLVARTLYASARFAI